MPRKKSTLGKSAEQIAETPAPAAAPAPEQTPEKKWAEPYRPIITNQAAGLEMGESKLTNQLVFYFSQDPGTVVKDRLKHFGYRYHTQHKAWTVNATHETREIARKLANEFAGSIAQAR